MQPRVHITRNDMLRGDKSPIGVVTPQFVGQQYIDSTGSVYIAYALDKNNWVATQPKVDPNLKTQSKEITGALNELNNTKRDKSVKITKHDLDISKNSTKIGIENLSDEVRQAMIGNTPIHSVIENKSITQEKIAPKTIREEHITCIENSINLFNPYDEEVVIGAYYNGANPVQASTYYYTHPIPVYPGDTITIRYAEAQAGSYFSQNGTYLGRLGTTSGTASPFTFTIPESAKDVAYVILNGKTDHLYQDMIVKGTDYPTEYIPYVNNLSPKVKITKDNIPNQTLGIEKFKQDINLAFDKYYVPNRVYEASASGTTAPVESANCYQYKIDLEDLGFNPLPLVIPRHINTASYYMYYFVASDGTILNKSSYSLEPIFKIKNVPTGTRYIVVQYAYSLCEPNKAQIIVGEEMPESFVEPGLPKYYIERHLNNLQQHSDNYTDTEVNNKLTSFRDSLYSFSENLFNCNHEDNIPGTFIGSNSGNTNNTVPSTFLTHYIPVKPNTAYTYNFTRGIYGSNRHYGVYDSNFNHIPHTTDVVLPEDLSTLTLTTPNDPRVAYIRVNLAKDTYTQSMVVEGTELPSEFVKFKGVLNEDFGLNNNQTQEVREVSQEVIENVITNEIEYKNINNPLYNKIAVFDGDSICHGTSAKDNKSGWAGRIGTRNNMTWHNFGISGGTITSEMYTSTGSARHWISRSIDNIYAKYPNADYIILEGGTNDADLLNSLPDKLGTISTNYTGPYDDTTFIGALESLFYKAITYYPTKKIGFIVAHKMGTIRGTWDTCNRNVFFNHVRAVCKKWGIPFLDLWYDSHLCQDIPKIRELMYTDNQHLSSLGYDYVSDIIEAWMKTL